MAMYGGDSPVMTESERRAYRYGQAAPRLQGLGLGLGGMRKSWSNESLSSYLGAGSKAGSHSCVCAPTTHPGSFRCQHHRHHQHQHASNLGSAASHPHAPSTAPDAEHNADAKHREPAHDEMTSADQEEKAL